MSTLEHIPLDAFRPLYGVDALELHGATCFRAPLAPDSPMMNRVAGLGVDRAPSEDELDEVLAAMGDTSFYVDVSPEADPRLDEMLERRGLEHGWGWMMFERDGRDAPPVDTSLRVERIGDDGATDFARVVATGYELPPSTHALFERVPTAAGWTGFLAFDGDEPVAAAAIWIDGSAAYCSFASTLPEARGKGAQSALLAARIELARAVGCGLLVTETGELRDGLPSNSYRNIRRFGFEERFVVAHRLRPRAQPQPSTA